LAFGNLAVSIADKNKAAADVHGYVYRPTVSACVKQAGVWYVYIIGVGFSVARSSAMGNARASESRTSSEYDTRALFMFHPACNGCRRAPIFYSMQKNFAKKALAILSAAVVCGGMLSSCGGAKNLLIPHSVSTASVTTVSDLGLKQGQYDILNTVKETASVRCEYKGNAIRIESGDGDFSYKFSFDNKVGWRLDSFQGAASLGYFAADIEEAASYAPQPEEFSRRVAMAKIIKAVTDYGADGIVEPVIVTNATNVGDRKVEYTTTVRAKLVVVKPTN